MVKIDFIYKNNIFENNYKNLLLMHDFKLNRIKILFFVKQFIK